MRRECWTLRVCYLRLLGKTSQEATVEEAVLETGQEEVPEERAGVGVSAESDELEAKTQENPHQHPMRRHERMKGLQETSR